MRYHAEMIATTDAGRGWLESVDASCVEFGTAQEAFEAARARIANVGGRPHNGVEPWVFAYDETKYDAPWDAYEANDFVEIAVEGE